MGCSSIGICVFPAYGAEVTAPSGKYDCIVHITSSAVRGDHTASSKPKSTGLRCSGSLPRCHLPHIPVAYPESERVCAMLTSQRVKKLEGRQSFETGAPGTV